jgi:Protein of unknown function (DUF3667)
MEHGAMNDVAEVCANCGTPRADRFCAVCGQNSRVYLRETREIIGELAGETLQWDSRLLVTLRALLLRPGLLTREFSRGRRASYVSPVRLYLVVSIVFFSVLSLTNRFEVETPRVAAETAEPMEHDADLDRMYNQLTPTQRARLKTILQQYGMTTPALQEHLEQLERTAPTAPPESLSVFESAVQDRVLDLLEDPRDAMQALIADMPAAMFLTLPLYAAWLKLLYRRRFYIEHLVFALHLHSFLFFVGTFMLLLPDTEPESAAQFVVWLYRLGDGVSSVLAIGAIAYYGIALKVVYDEGWVRTAGKWILINLAHAVFIALGVALVAVVALVLF